MTASNHLFAALSTIEFMVLLAIVLAIAIAGIVMLVVYFKNKKVLAQVGQNVVSGESLLATR